MKVYAGGRTSTGEPFVLVDGRLLPLRLDLANHSPTGFAWGYGGSGPAQLALAILADHCPVPEDALPYYQSFKWAFVAKWDNEWTPDVPHDQRLAFLARLAPGPEADP